MVNKFSAIVGCYTKNKVFLGYSCVLIFFLGFLISLSVGQNIATVEKLAITEPGDKPLVNEIDIVVPKGRIEEGVRLDASMFTTVAIEQDKVPLAAVRKNDMNQIIGKFSTQPLAPNVPLNFDNISSFRELGACLPAGYRAVKITVDSHSGVEGFAKPNSRADVLWTFTQDGQQKITVIASFLKVISIGEFKAANVNTITLAATEKDAKKIELAKTLGTLSLSLHELGNE